MTQTTDRADAAAAKREARAAAAAPDASGAFTHRQVLTILAGLLLGMFLAALDQTVVSTAIRVIADDLQGYDLQAWATTAFLITSTISTPLYGKLSDIYGRRPFFLFAITVFVLGSALCGISTSMYELAGWRALQGIGAGGLMSMALAIIADIVPPRERSKYQGYFMAVFGTSSVLGPVIGGFLAGQTTILGLDGWRWIFWINVPLGAFALIVVARVLHLPHQRQNHRIDYPGAISLITFLVPLLIVAEQGRLWGWGSGRALLCYAVGALGFVAFVLFERAYKDEALLPLRLFRNRTFSVSAIAGLVVGMGMFGGLLLLPQYLQVVHGSSPTIAGLQMIPLVLGIMSAAVTSGLIISKTGQYKVFPLIGVVLMVAALTSMYFVTDADTSTWTLVPFMVMLGLGLGFNFQPITLAVQNAVDPREIGVATSSATFFRQMGGTLGTAVFLSLLFSRLPIDIGNQVASAAAGNPDVAAQAQQLQQSAGGFGSLLSDTAAIQQFPLLIQPFRVGFTTSLDLVFLIAAAILVLGFIALLFLPQIPLRTQSGIQARQGGAPTSDAPADKPGEVAANSAGAAAPTSSAATDTDPANPDGGAVDSSPGRGGASRRASPDGAPSPSDPGRHARVTGGPIGRHEDGSRSPHGKHEGSEGGPTGLDSVPADHLPAGRPKD